MALVHRSTQPAGADLKCTHATRSVRCRYASKLLRRAGQTVDDIAAISGLGTGTTFFRLFVEQFGMRPDEYRRG